jgi:glyoxylase-like metal-dependent hydrolase (beta-lactamase superfamily II)
MENRRSFLKRGSLAAGLTLLPWQRILAGFFGTEDAPYTMKELHGGIGIFSERGGTIGWMVSDDGFIVIDAQFPEQAGHLIQELQKHSGFEIHTLYNTHHHGDHTAGNIAFKGLAKKVVAHQNSKINQRNAALARGSEEGQWYPDTTFETKWSETVGQEKISLHYWGRAHTNGDAVIHFENANIVHMGDLVFNRRFPYIDTGAGAHIGNWIDVLQKTQKYFDRDTRFIFGHALDPEAVTGDLNDIKAMENYLTSLLDFVDLKKKAGVSKEELRQATAIPGAEEWQGSGIERSIDAAWLEISGGNPL